MAPVDVTKLTPVDKLEGEDWSETEGIEELVSAAEDFISEFGWAGNILQQYAGPVIPGVIGVFLFRLDPAKADVDEWLWVVVGDLPPAYLVTDDAPTPIAAIEVYIDAMQEWVDAVKKGESVEDLIPVNVPETTEHAEQLSSRLQFLKNRVIPELRAVDGSDT